MIFATLGWSQSAKILISLIKHSSALCLLIALLLTRRNLIATLLFKLRSYASLTLYLDLE